MAGAGVAVGAIAALGSLAITTAGALGAFDEDIPDPPERDDPALEARRRRQLIAAGKRTGRQGTILTTTNQDPPEVTRPTLLGGASEATGGFSAG